MSEIADGGEHRQHGFNQQAGVPSAAFTDFQIRGITRYAMKARIDQDDHLICELRDQGPRTAAFSARMDQFNFTRV